MRLCALVRLSVRAVVRRVPPSPLGRPPPPPVRLAGRCLVLRFNNSLHDVLLLVVLVLLRRRFVAVLLAARPRLATRILSWPLVAARLRLLVVTMMKAIMLS